MNSAGTTLAEGIPDGWPASGQIAGRVTFGYVRPHDTSTLWGRQNEPVDEAEAPRWRIEAAAAGTTAGDPCTPNELDAAERLLGRALPTDLRTLYAAADGFFDEPGQWFVIWPLERVVEDNIRAWAEGKLRRDLLAFGDDGTGNPFCIAIGSDEVREVVRWSWVDDDIEGVLVVGEFLAEWANLKEFPSE